MTGRLTRVMLRTPCPACGSKQTRITSTNVQKNHIRRYRKCYHCGKAFITEQPHEKVVDVARQRRLSDDDVREIRVMAEMGYSSYECALTYGIDQKTAWNAINRRTFADVQ